MRYKAFILLLVVLTYIREWDAMAAGMAMPAEKDCCAGSGNLAGQGSCMDPGAQENTGKPGNAGKKRDSDKQGNTNKERNTGTDECMSCPMCFNMLVPEHPVLTGLVTTVKTSYPRFQSAYLHEYHPYAWKPPNQALHT